MVCSAAIDALTEGGEGRGHIVAAARLQLVNCTERICYSESIVKTVASRQTKETQMRVILLCCIIVVFHGGALWCMMACNYELQFFSITYCKLLMINCYVTCIWLGFVRLAVIKCTCSINHITTCFGIASVKQNMV